MELLSVVYYFNAQLYLVAPGSALSPIAAIAIGIASLIIGWITYTFLCDSALGKKPLLLGIILFLLLVIAAWGLSQLFSGRGAFIHVGAIIGTIMVGNVFFVIMPVQRDMVAAMSVKKTPDPSLPAKGLLRSRHNNYFTLPVLFIMISSHFPSTFGHTYNWAVLAALSIISVMVRHYFNTRHLNQKYAWTIPAAALGMICLAFIVSPTKTSTSSQLEPVAGGVTDTLNPVAVANTHNSFNKIQTIIEKHCTTCHSQTPSSPLFSAAPAGVMFDTPQQIKLLAPNIYAQSVASIVMPLGNITKMTEQERELLGQWIIKGANIE
jgi:uncharacterized membrane protein